MSINNLNALLKDLAKYKVDVLQGIDAELTATAYDIEADAKLNLKAVDDGNLRQSIAVSENKPFLKIVKSNANYSAYVEFGTGALVDVPKDLANYAMQFKGAGIKQVNLPARPFFFPAYFKNVRECYERIKVIINEGRK